MLRDTLGAQVVQHDDGSQDGMYDLRVVRPGLPPAAVEVTAAADADSIELWRLVNGRDERWMDPALRGGWMLSLRPTARAKLLLREAPAFLANLEERKVTEVSSTPMRLAPGPDAERALELGIVHAHQSDTAYPGSIYVTLARDVSQVAGFTSASGDTTAAWIGNFLSAPQQADVLRKLARSTARERHAFIFVPAFSSAPFGVTDLLLREDDSVPGAAPILPEEVNHVWLLGTYAVGSGLRWSPDTGWGRFRKLLEVEEETAVVF